MNEMFGKKLIFAHRGVSQSAPENTLPAFELAMQQGVDGVELDVMLTKDKQIVVVHDFELGRTSDKRGFVEKMTLAEIKSVDAGGWFDEKFSNTRIPTLREVFDLIGGKLLINIEIKMHRKDKSTELINRTLNLVREYDIEDTVIYSSFNPFPLFCIKRKNLKTPIGFLSFGTKLGKFFQIIYGKILLRPNAYHLNKNHVSEKIIQKAHQKGIAIRSYTVNEREEMQKFFAWGIDGIFTDNPILALSVRAGDEKKSL